jgi:hypothetical protein
MSCVVCGPERPRPLLGFRSVTLRPNLSIGLPLSKLKLSHGTARGMPLFKTKGIEFLGSSGVVSRRSVRLPNKWLMSNRFSG